MREIDILINEGFASAITDDIMGNDEMTISHDALPVVFSVLGASRVGKWKEIHSTRISSKKYMRLFLNGRASKKRDCLIIGKSMGVVEIIDYLDEYWPRIHDYKKIGVVFVDGHSKLLKEIFKKRYGEERNIERLPEWKRNKIQFYNFFQWDLYPMGASMPQADYNMQLHNTDHFSLIHRPEVLKGIRDMCNWLKK